MYECARCSMFAACCRLPVICYLVLLRVARWLLFVGWCLLCVLRLLLFAVCSLSLGVCCGMCCVVCVAVCPLVVVFVVWSMLCVGCCVVFLCVLGVVLFGVRFVSCVACSCFFWLMYSVRCLLCAGLCALHDE